MKQPGLYPLADPPIRRYLDPDCGCIAAKLLPGQFYVTGGEAVVTVLGSCVAACIRDRITGVGGMNHFMLPVGTDQPDAPPSAATRYGNHAMERLINEILRLGGRRANLEAKVFGGARVLAIKSDIGRRNGDFVQAYLHLEGLPLVARDLGGIHPRKVIFFPKEGLVRVRRLATGQEPEVFARERSYYQALATQAIGGPIEIF